jgi:hypothetical protein
VLERAPDLASEALDLVATLGGFDKDIVAAQTRQIIREAGKIAWRAPLYHGAVARQLDQWPKDGNARHVIARTLVKFLRVSEWTGLIAGRAFRFCPEPRVAAELLREIVSDIRAPKVRRIAGGTLLLIHEHRLDIIREWLVSSDLWLARTAGDMVAWLYLNDRAELKDLRTALLDADVVTREKVREALAVVADPSPALQELVAESRALPPEDWACLECETRNPPEQHSCSSCHQVR